MSLRISLTFLLLFGSLLSAIIEAKPAADQQQDPEVTTDQEAVTKANQDVVPKADQDVGSKGNQFSTDPLLDIQCENWNGTDVYVVPDPTHCDRYLSCPEGQLEICQMGLIIDLDTGYCIRRRLTNCTGRERLFRDVENEVEAKSLYP